jgi:hypothetical protein
LSRNLISISCLDDDGYDCQFGNRQYLILFNSKVVGLAFRQDNLYMLSMHENENVVCVTSHVTKILIKLFKISPKAKANQVIEDANQNLNYQDFKFEVFKCYLVWADILSQKIFRIDLSRIRPCSQK